MELDDSAWLCEEIDKRIIRGDSNHKIVNELLIEYVNQKQKAISRYALSSKVKRRRSYHTFNIKNS